MTKTHAPIEGTVKEHTYDSTQATCANCAQVIVKWDYIDNDGDRVRRVFQDWAIEVPVRVSDTVTRFERVEVCG